MDLLFTAAIQKVSELPLPMQREIGAALLSREEAATLPVIDFTDPTLDRSRSTHDTEVT